MSSARASRKLVVAVDFGTTYSGVAYWLGRGKPELRDVKVVSGFPALRSFDSDKPAVPSEIYYGSNGTIHCGYNVPEGKVPIRWAKILLLQENDLPKYLQHGRSYYLKKARKHIKALGKSIVDVIADYLRFLWQHALIKIEQQEASVVVDDCYLHIVLTVPAIWKDYAREKMRVAAKLAGILDHRSKGVVSFEMRSEPEAAAFATFHSHTFNNQDAKAGETVIVYDGGGGTGDILSYVIKKYVAESATTVGQIQLKECVEGDGDLCGAMFVDEAFERYIKERVGAHFWDQASATEIADGFHNYWENGIKRDFDGRERLMRIRIGGRSIDLNEEEIKGCFEGVILKIQGLLLKQAIAIKKKTSNPPTYIFLVGGFGRNQWIYNIIRKEFPRSRVIKGPGDEPWSAICRGAALLRSIEICASEDVSTTHLNPVLSRVCRNSIGWIYDEPLSDLHTKEQQENATWNEVRAEYMVLDKIEWIAKRGQDINTCQDKKEYTILFPLNTRGHWDETYDVYESPSTEPSCQLLEFDEEIKPTGQTIILRTPVPVQELPTEKNKLGELCRAFHIKWIIKADGAALSAVAYSENQVVGRLSIPEL